MKRTIKHLLISFTLLFFFFGSTYTVEAFTFTFIKKDPVDTKIKDFVITDSVSTLQLKKIILPNKSTLPLTGFDPTHMNYETTLVKSEQTKKVTIKFSYHPSLTPRVIIDNDTLGYAKEIFMAEDGTFSFDLYPNCIYSFQIILSDNGVSESSTYKFTLFPDVDISTSFQMFQTVNETDYCFQSNYLKTGDILSVTVPAHLMSSKKKHTFTKSVENFWEGTKDVRTTQDFICLFTEGKKKVNFKPNKLKDKLEVSIKRNGKIIYSGSYTYDYTPLKVEVANPSLYTTTFSTVEEIEAMNEGASYEIYVYFRTTTLNFENIKKLYPTAETYAKDQFANPKTIYSIETLKLRANERHLEHGVRDIASLESYKPAKELVNGKYTLKSTQIYDVIILFDKNQKPIKVLSITTPIPLSIIPKDIIIPKNK